MWLLAFFARGDGRGALWHFEALCGTLWHFVALRRKSTSRCAASAVSQIPARCLRTKLKDRFTPIQKISSALGHRKSSVDMSSLKLAAAQL